MIVRIWWRIFWEDLPLIRLRPVPNEQIAQDLGVSVRTVRRWLRTFVQRGLAQMVPPWGLGRPAKIPEAEVDCIK